MCLGGASMRCIVLDAEYVVCDEFVVPYEGLVKISCVTRLPSLVVHHFPLCLVVSRGLHCVCMHLCCRP